MSQVIYTRVPDEVKDAADAYASERGATLSSAVVDLLERGLTSVADECSIARLQENLAEVSARYAQTATELGAARSELAAVKALSQRASLPIGHCPRCEGQISGYDLLAAGECPRCKQPLSDLIAPKSKTSGLDQREFLMLVGALGAVVGLALLASK
jgi:hypothetical protein